MSTEVSLLGYNTLSDIVANYSSADAAARFILPKRVLDRMTPLVRMLPLKSSNNILSNIATRTDSLPVASTRRFNEGILATASKNVPINDPIALFEDYSEVDKDLWEIQNEPNSWRSDQDMNHIEGLFQMMESMLLYGSLATSPGAFNGLATRFNNLTSRPNGDASWQPNVWDGGSTTASSVTSAWMIEFGDDTFYGIYPPNSPAGLSVRDLGEVTKELAAGTGATGANYLYQVLRTMLRWYLGIQIADERCVQRIANINPTALAGNNFDENIFIEAKNWLPRGGEAPGTVILVNRAIKTQIDIRAVSQKLNTYFTPPSNGTMDVFGKAVTRFQNIPIYVAEKILSTESVVTA
jgi:hypothetical protein